MRDHLNTFKQHSPSDALEMQILLYENWFVIHNCTGNLFSTEAGHITGSGMGKRPAASETQYHQTKNTAMYFLQFQLLYMKYNLP